MSLSLVQAGVIYPSEKILEGPSSKVTLTGPDGSVIHAYLPGGKILTDDYSSFLAQAAPVVKVEAPMDIIRDTLIHNIDSMLASAGPSLEITHNDGASEVAVARPEISTQTLVAETGQNVAEEIAATESDTQAVEAESDKDEKENGEGDLSENVDDHASEVVADESDNHSEHEESKHEGLEHADLEHEDSEQNVKGELEKEDSLKDSHEEFGEHKYHQNFDHEHGHLF